VVTNTDYPDGYPLFTYEADGRLATICLRHPPDGSVPPPLTQVRDETRREVERRRRAGEPSDPLLDQMLRALESLVDSLPAVGSRT
jgi:hypothetical protein